VSGSAELAVEADARFDLKLGIDLSKPSSPKPFLQDTTGLTLSARILGTKMAFTAAAGPLGIFIKYGRVTLDQDGNPDTDERAVFRVGLEDAPSGNRYFLSDLSTSIVDVTLQGGVRVNLPVFFPTEDNRLQPDLAITIPDLAALFEGDVDQVDITAPDLAKAIEDLNLGLNLDSVLDGLDLLLGAIEGALDGEVFGVSLPLIGDSLQDAATFIQNFRKNVLAELRDLLNDAPSQGIALVQKAIFNSIGPDGLDFLRLNPNFHDAGDDGVKDPTADFRDVAFAKDSAQNPTEIQFNLKLQKELPISRNIDFDIGLPALGLDVTGKVDLKLGFEFDFSFGVSKDDGFYFDTSTANELEVFFTAAIPGLNAKGELAFLALRVKDDADDPSLFDGRFLVDVTDPNDDGRLTFSEFSSPAMDFDTMIDAALTAVADINLETQVSFGGSAVFPSLRADFNLDWRFQSADTGANAGNFGGVPQIAFRNVELDMGSFLSDFVGPILKKVQEVLEPILRIIDVLT
jgi:hypothetical protein